MSYDEVKEGIAFLVITVLFLWCISAGHLLGGM